MLNSRELLGRECPKGITGLIINLGAALSFITLGASSSYLAWNHQWEGFPIGQALVVFIGILLLIGYFSLKNKKILNRLSGLETRLEKAEKKP
jgi:sulfite exporter TauE/SafE